MTINSEQIQALKAAENITEQLPAALEAWEKSNQGSVTLGWIHAANPVAVESLLAERDADKALIAEQAKRIAELEASLKNLRESMAAIHNTIRLDGAGVSLSVLLSASKRAYEESAAAAGITLVVGE
ncbi:hypothetical protein CRX67_03885 [Enterobacteriaceae bacterium A-F18]|nr:hypothetical protein CRX67_03885 [Enterobacteriaceae bacterium A-F18]